MHPQVFAASASYRPTHRPRDVTLTPFSLRVGLPEVVVLAPPLRIFCPRRLTGWTMHVCLQCVPTVEEEQRSQIHPENSPALELKMRSAWYWWLACLIRRGVRTAVRGGPLSASPPLSLGERTVLLLYQTRQGHDDFFRASKRWGGYRL